VTTSHRSRSLIFVVSTMLFGVWLTSLLAADSWLVFPGGEVPGQGKHIVFIASEEAYRSEESMPVIGHILSREGIKCTLLFAIDPADDTINPKIKDNMPGLEKLDTADLLVAFLRWRELPDDQMKRIIDYTKSGKPIVGIRNATHPFRYAKRPDSPYTRFDSTSKDPDRGWGRLVLGETWVSLYGKNLVGSTRCNILEAASSHPIFKGIRTGFWIPDDVYRISSSLSGDSTPALMGGSRGLDGRCQACFRKDTPNPLPGQNRMRGRRGKRQGDSPRRWAMETHLKSKHSAGCSPTPAYGA
jgi:hypothetical protein